MFCDGLAASGNPSLHEELHQEGIKAMCNISISPYVEEIQFKLKKLTSI